VPILKQQLADLEAKPPEEVGFDSAYGYSPATGLLGYSRKVRFLEQTSDGESIILVDNAALVVPGLDTGGYASGKFFSVEQAFLIGTPREDYTFQGRPRKSYFATLVDLNAVLQAGRSSPVPEANTGAGKSGSAAAAAAPIENRPKVPGVLRLHLRERRETPAGSGKIEVVERSVDWNVAETAIIVCDMWDDHHCKIAAQRVGVMAPRMNAVLTAARDRGVMIIHAPSDTMKFYADTPYRARMQAALPAEPPVPIERRCDVDPSREPALLPVDRKLDCDDPTLGPAGPQHTRQNAAIDIIGFDGISDDGKEIYNFCEQEGIKHIVLMGVHTNYCVLARSFGIRQMVRLGRNVVLARDLTDALYDPRQPPYVSHARGTEMVVEHIEQYWCPSILSEDLTRVVPGSDGPLAAMPPAPVKD
jgi:nicotinamidase-related amidase